MLFAFEAQRIAAGLPADVAMVGGEPHHDAVATRSALAALGYEDMGEAGVPGRIYLRRRADTAFNIALVVREYAEAKRSAF